MIDRLVQSVVLLVSSCGFCVSIWAFLEHANTGRAWEAVGALVVGGVNLTFIVLSSFRLFGRWISRRTICRSRCWQSMTVVRSRHLSSCDIETSRGPAEHRSYEILLRCDACERLHLRFVTATVPKFLQ